MQNLGEKSVVNSSANKVNKTGVVSVGELTLNSSPLGLEQVGQEESSNGGLTGLLIDEFTGRTSGLDEFRKQTNSKKGNLEPGEITGLRDSVDKKGLELGIIRMNN